MSSVQFTDCFSKQISRTWTRNLCSLPREDKLRRRFIKGIVIDIAIDIDGDTLMFPFKHWMRHTAMVPKGFLRYRVLKLLSEKPRSGSELMSEIENQTEGRWRPSPGSIYPLLSWLQDKNHIKEADGQEAGVKRYVLTESGKALLAEHDKRREELRKRFPHFGPGPSFMGPMWFEFYPEKAKELRKATKNLAIAIWRLRDQLRQEYSEKAAAEATKALEEAARKIEEITKKP